MDGDNDNNDPWKTLSAVTEKVLRLDEKQDEKGSGDTDADRGGEKKCYTHSEYVEQRLRELAAFERRARGLR